MAYRLTWDASQSQVGERPFAAVDDHESGVHGMRRLPASHGNTNRVRNDSGLLQVPFARADI